MAPEDAKPEELTEAQKNAELTPEQIAENEAAEAKLAEEAKAAEEAAKQEETPDQKTIEEQQAIQDEKDLKRVDIWVCGDCGREYEGKPPYPNPCLGCGCIDEDAYRLKEWDENIPQEATTPAAGREEVPVDEETKQKQLQEVEDAARERITNLTDRGAVDQIAKDIAGSDLSDEVKGQLQEQLQNKAVELEEAAKAAESNPEGDPGEGVQEEPVNDEELTDEGAKAAGEEEPPAEQPAADGEQQGGEGEQTPPPAEQDAPAGDQASEEKPEA